MMNETATAPKTHGALSAEADLLTESMRRQREVARALLSPSAADLERGLEIHRSSLVAEPYCLGMMAPVVAEEINREMDAGGSSVDVTDLLNEQHTLNWLRCPQWRAAYARTWQATGVTCAFQNAGEDCNDPKRLLKRLARVSFLVDAMPELLVRGTSVQRIRAAYAEGKQAICLSLCGVPLSGNQADTADELRYIRVFAQLGVRAMHLTYNRRNPIGDGCGEPSDGGLSAFGHDAVSELNRWGVLIDLAHSGWKTCLDVCRTTRQPVIVSHSTVHALSGHIRAKPDEVIRAVVDTGGVLGVTTIPAFLGGRGDIVTFMDHIDYMVKHFGEDSVAIGTDRVYSPVPDADVSVGIKPRMAARTPWERLWPRGGSGVSDPEWTRPEQTESLAWTNWPLFTVGLVQRGYREEVIRKILGENLLRVASAVWRSPEDVFDPITARGS